MSDVGGSFRGKRQRAAWAAVVAVAALIGPGIPAPAIALDIDGYSATVNDRFTSGFPTAPVPNTDGSYVGLPYDWSGVGWSTATYAASSYKGFGFISPQHYLVAAHYGGDSTPRLRLADGTLVSGTEQAVNNTGYGVSLSGTRDISIGELTAPLPDFNMMARYAVLDLLPNSLSGNLSVYDGLSLLAYGRGNATSDSPRVGATTVAAAGFLGADPTQPVILTPRTGGSTVQLVVGDSGSPLFHGWTNPNGGSELTILGLNTAVDVTYNYMSFLAAPAAMTAVNAIMNPDGFALRVAGNPTATWTGNASSDLGTATNYSGSPFLDNYFKFDPAVAVTRSITVDVNTQPRGLYFASTGNATDGFTFSGSTTLTIGRGGIVNYDNSLQTFTAPLALGASQYWDVGPGGMTVGAINTGGFLVEVAGSGTATITGNVSGSGGVALSGSRLKMTGTSSYTGGTWVHSGTLVVGGSIASSSGVVVDAGAAIAGSGAVPALSGAGSVDPGNSPGILTSPSLNPSGGLDFNFEFTQTGSPTWGNASASGNDVLRLTDGSTPLTSALTSGNAVNVYLNVGSLSFGDTFRGGFFTDRDVDFLSSIGNGTYSYFLADGGGSVIYSGVNYSAYAGPFTFDWSTVAVTANFSGGTENGFVSQFTAVPEPGTWAMLTALAGGAMWWRRRGRVDVAE